MSRSEMNLNTRTPERVRILFWERTALAVFCVVVDRFLKFLATGPGFSDAGTWFFRWTLFKNDGIAFSLPLPAYFFWPLLLVMAVMLTMLFREQWGDRSARAAALFILLGAASNIYDRLIYGATIDYALFFGRSAVNIADGMILAGLFAIFFISQRSASAPLKKPGS